MSKRHTFWGILATVLMLGLGGCIPTELHSTPTPSPTPAGPRRIVKNTLGLREYWHVPFSCLGGTLVAAPGRVLCEFYDPAMAGSTVRVLNAVNGDLLWETGWVPGGVAEVAADAGRVYLEAHSKLRAYDLEDGHLLWARQFTPRRGHSYDPDGDKLYIRQGGSGEDFLYTLDARTGGILGTESLWTSDHFLVFARFPQLELQILTVKEPFTLRAVDPATQRTLWQVEQRPGLFLQNLKWPPVLLDDLLLLDTKGEVIALDVQSGQVKWRTSDPARSPDIILATGAVMVDDSLYALRWDARLVRRDARSGQETGYIQFAPPLSDKNIYGGGNGIGLDGDGRMLFVSFDDSNELIALGP